MGNAMFPDVLFYEVVYNAFLRAPTVVYSDGNCGWWWYNGFYIHESGARGASKDEPYDGHVTSTLKLPSEQHYPLHTEGGLRIR
jgi:hypothetical protein